MHLQLRQNSNFQVEGVYTASGEILNFWRSQSGSDLNDREKGDIEAISPTGNRSKMGRYDGRQKLRISPLAVYAPDS